MRVNSKPFFTDFRCTWFGKFANPTYPGVSGLVNCPCWSQENRTIDEDTHLKSLTTQLSEIHDSLKSLSKPFLCTSNPHKTQTQCNIHASALISLPSVFQLETFWARTKPAKIISFETRLIYNMDVTTLYERTNLSVKKMNYLYVAEWVEPTCTRKPSIKWKVSQLYRNRKSVPVCEHQSHHKPAPAILHEPVRALKIKALFTHFNSNKESILYFCWMKWKKEIKTHGVFEKDMGLWILLWWTLEGLGVKKAGHHWIRRTYPYRSETIGWETRLGLKPRGQTEASFKSI